MRFFDRKVARLVGYRDARANYAMLQEIPLRLREHAKNKQSDVETAKAHVAEVERQALIADGIEPLEAKGAVARAAVEKAEQAEATITAALRAIEAEREKVTRDDAVHGRAADLLAETLARADLRELYEDAVRTPTKTDDQAISAISAARSKLQQADGEVTRIRPKFATWPAAAASSKAPATAPVVSVMTIRGAHSAAAAKMFWARSLAVSWAGWRAAALWTASYATTTGDGKPASIPISGGAAAARPGPGLGWRCRGPLGRGRSRRRLAYRRRLLSGLL